MPKPSEIYLGVIDFFAVILPGAIAAAILQQAFGAAALGTVVAVPKSETAQWAVFLVSAYLLGHLIFLMGSLLDPASEVLRGWFIKPNRFRRLHAWAGVPKLLDENEKAFLQVRKVRNSMLAPEIQLAVNPFQWARAALVSKCPDGAADVERMEADSKFFRSFVMVTLFTGIAYLAKAHYVEGAVAFVLMIPCFARYFERRMKSHTQAYIHILTMHGLGEFTRKMKETAAATAAPGPSLHP